MKKRGLSILLALCLCLSLLPPAAVAAEQHTHGNDTFKTKWEGGVKTQSITQSKTIYLSADTNLEKTLTINKNKVLSLCLNGNILTASGGIVVDRGATLNIYDCSDSAGGKITGSYNGDNGLITLSGGTVNVYGGTIENRNPNGNTIYVGQNSALHVFGGAVRKDAESNDCIGSAICCANGGSVSITGGAVRCATNCDSCYAISHMGGTLTVGGTAVVSNTAAGSAVSLFPQGAATQTHITGGTITAEHSAAIRLSGSNSKRINTVFLSGSPTILGGAGQAAVSMDKLIDKLYATAAEDSGSERYAGEPLTIAVKTYEMGDLVVRNTEDTGKFQLITEKQDASLTASGGNLLIAAPHVHAWSEDWSSDASGHWRVCTSDGCSMTDSYEAHAVSGDGECTTADVCAVCGYVCAVAKEHDLQYAAQDNTITETCANEGCAHCETAAICAPEGALVYDGTTQFDAAVVCSDGWKGEKPEISYLKNNTQTDGTTGAGDYAASITAGGVTASASYRVEKAPREAPSLAAGCNTTRADALDGRITGVDEAMEYRGESEETYTAVTGDEITNLAAGTYYVRYAETENHEPSADRRIVIEKGGKLPVKIEISTDFDKDYDGLPLSVSRDDFTYAGDGEVIICWYEDQNGTKGAALTEAPLDAGTYWLGIAARESARYQAASEAVIPVAIRPKEIKIEWASDDFIYNGEDQTASVTASYIDSYGNYVNLRTSTEHEFRNCNEGGYRFEATFANGETNYKLPDENAKIYHMKKASAAPVTFPEASPITYGQALSASALTGGAGDGTFAWKDENRIPTVKNEGYAVVFQPRDVENYDYDGVALEQIVPVSVSKAVPSCTAPENLTATYGQTLADIVLPDGWAWDAPAQCVGSVGEHRFNATFTPDDAENYQTVTEMLTVAVGKAKPEYTVPIGLTATYGQTLAAVALPDGWAWDAPAQCVGSAGEHYFNATYTPYDSENYCTVTLPVAVAVSKAVPSYTAPENLTATYGQTLADIVLPDGWAWNDSAQRVGDAGEHHFGATYTPDDADNYQTVTEMLTVAVGKAKPEYTVPIGLTATYGQTLADIVLPDGWAWDAPAQCVGSAGEHHFSATYTPEDTVNYEAASVALTLRVAQCAPRLNTAPAASAVRAGSQLSASVLTGGAVTGLDGKVLEGDWTWQNGRELTEAGTVAEIAIFTPADTNYAPLAAKIEVTVYRDSGAERPAEPSAPPAQEVFHETIKSGKTQNTSGNQAPAFADVDKSAWYYDAVEYVRERGLMGGIGGEKFAPEGKTTRGMIVTILYRLSGSPRVRSDGAYWWSDAKVWAMEYGVSDGSGMDSAITREQLAAMLFRCVSATGADVSARSGLSRFADSANVSDWAKDAMQWAVAEGIIGGRGGTLDPKGLATRAEAAAMFMRFDKIAG